LHDHHQVELEEGLVAHPGYLCFAGTEIVNNCRTVAYARAGLATVQIEDCYCCPDPGFPAAVGAPVGGYTLPQPDEAPWYDASEPSSAEFGGFYVLSADGLGPGETTRTLTERASGGGSLLGRAKQTSPQVTVTGVLFGKTCCAATYGLRWLRSILRGPCGSADGCNGGDLLFFDCCPDLDCGDTPQACAQPYQRLLKDVAVIQSPRITGQFHGTSNCAGVADCQGASVLQVEFTLSAGRPCVYGNVLDVATVALGNVNDECVEWLPVAAGKCPGDPCAPAPSALIDPECPPPPAPPRAPVVLNDCYCNPIATNLTCVDIPGNLVSSAATGVPVIEIRTGSQQLRGITLRFYANPIDVDPQFLDPCIACGEVTLSRLPPNSVFRMDGLERTVKVKTPGSVWTDAAQILGAAEGRLPFAYPVIECGGVQYTLCVTYDTDTVAANAQLYVGIAQQEC
jgi:hypothetical protein